MPKCECCKDRSSCPCCMPEASWREGMNTFNLEFPSICARAIIRHGYSACGIENQDAHYSGNFWYIITTANYAVNAKYFSLLTLISCYQRIPKNISNHVTYNYYHESFELFISGGLTVTTWQHWPHRTLDSMLGPTSSSFWKWLLITTTCPESSASAVLTACTTAMWIDTTWSVPEIGTEKTSSG